MANGIRDGVDIITGILQNNIHDYFLLNLTNLVIDQLIQVREGNDLVLRLQIKHK